MCGIFGLTITSESALRARYKGILKNLFLLSESRGKEASGFAINNGRELRYLRTPFPASVLVKSRLFEREIDNLLASEINHYTVIGHSRLVTNGYEQFNENNQPVVKNDMAVVHNGIIVNNRELWKKYADEPKLTDLDSELIPTLVRRFYESEKNLHKSLSMLYHEIYGMTSIAVLPFNFNNLILATNNGSLYYMESSGHEAFVFASERYILEKLIAESGLKPDFSPRAIYHLSANYTCAVSLHDTSHEVIPLDENLPGFRNISNGVALRPCEITGKVSSRPVPVNTSMEYLIKDVPTSFTEEVERRVRRIAALKRCRKCILPETFPFIEFDNQGICNYCNNHRPLEHKGWDEFRKLSDQYRSKDGSPDCLMPFSGGRDSSFALHTVKKELGMNPIAFSYDWGMLTDLARRNQSRLCGKLGVEHILVSADIRKKRENIRKNVTAWLKRPHLGTVPLFMAGDKQYFYFANLLMEQNKLKLSILGENRLETTYFKSGFCGIKPHFAKVNTYSLSTSDKLKMMLFYGKEYLLNPAYLNSSLADTFDAFKSYYVIKHQNINLFNYIPWEEEKIISLLRNEYDWETDPGTISTWRIGDGTAAFYNYIYLMVAGFTENDTFRSNQIREGLISREQALEKANRENTPRFDSIQWYCSTIGIDWIGAVNIINKIPSLYN